jgi:hypothetical protein
MADPLGATKLHTFRHASAGTLSWTVDEDCVLIYVNSNAGFVVSDDPAMTNSNWFAPPVGGTQTDNFYIAQNATSQLTCQFAIPLEAGQVVYSNAGLGNTVVQLIMVK